MHLFTRYLLSLAALFAAVVGGYFFAAFVCYRFPWSENDPLYYLLKVVERLSPVLIVLLLLAGFVWFTVRALRQPLSYLDDVIAAAKSLSDPAAPPIELPKELSDVENELNLARSRSQENLRARREAEQRKNDLIMYLAHDLKTPLSSVIGYLTLLHDEGEIAPALREKYLSIALDKANRLVIGGGMAYTFLKAKGLEVGTSLLEEDQVETVKGYIERAEQNGVELVLPTDIVVNPVFPKSDEDIAPEVVAADAIPADKMGLDIGPESQKLFHDKIVDSKTVVWNGPMGVFENPTLAKGTIAVAQALADSDAVTIVGGGDSAAACEQLGFADKITHISTGGGASLEFLEGLELPGIACLQDK